MKYILSVVTLLICANLSIFGQGVSIEIRDDKEFLKSLNYEKVSIEKEIDIKIPANEYIYGNYTTKMKCIELWDNPKIQFHTYKYAYLDYSKYHHEYFTVGENIVLLDSLLLATHNNLIEKTPYQLFFKSSLIKFRDNYFIIISSKNKIPYLDGEIYSYMVVSLDKTKKIDNVILFYNGYENGNLIFGDFSSKGKFNYLSWGVAENKIKLYKYSDTQFHLDKEHYIIVDMTKDQQQYYEEYGKNTSHFLNLNILESRWFCPLDSVSK
jgi:hypothetical protein